MGLAPVILKFEPPRKPHHILGVNLGFNFTKLWHISSIHVLERRVEQRVVHIHCRVRQILSVCERRTMNCIRLLAQSKGEGVVEGGVRPRVEDDRWEKCLRPIRWVGSPRPM